MKFIYDAESKEISLKFKNINKLKPLSENDFHLETKSILQVLSLAAQIYKKAQFFHRMFGKTPLINVDNLLIDENATTIIFRTMGMSLRSPYLIEGSAIGDEEEDIPRMIGKLLASLLVGDSREVQEFIEKRHTSEEAFLALFITKMSSKSSAQAYSCARFEYMVDKLVRASAKEINKS